MEKSEFFKRFRWWNFCPALLYAAAGIATLCTERAGIFSVAIACGVLFALAGTLNALAFFLSFSENVASLLTGVCGLAVALWLFVIRYVPLLVFCIALAALITLYALSEVLEAISQREGGGKRGIRIARIVLAAVVAGLADGFATAAFFAPHITSVLVAGAALLGASVCTLFFTFLRGMFVPEEKLHFRPVK